MKYIGLVLIVLLTGCVTRHYHVHTDAPYKASDRVSQQLTNEIWGTSQLRVIRVRKIPQNTMADAKCNDGFVQFCKQ